MVNSTDDDSVSHRRDHSVAWLHFAEDVTGAAPLSMGGKLGLWLFEKLQVWTGSVKISFFISSALILLWIIAAGMDTIIALALFFINKPYIWEIVKEKIVEVEKPVAPVVRTELKAQPKPQRQPVKRSDEPKTMLADVTQFRWDYVMESGFRALTAALALWLPGVHFPWGLGG